jgi:Holliday junction resolvase RusA-like endonuclease
MIEFFIPGKPVAKASVRFGNGMTFKDKKTEVYMDLVKLIADKTCRGLMPMDGPVEVLIIATRNIPSSWSGKKTRAALAGELLPITRPDVDNYCKMILDGMNGIVYVDDNRVVRLVAEKKFGAKTGVYVRVRPL